MEVGFEDCQRELLDRVDGEATRRYREWRGRSGHSEVVAFVENFTHRYLYEITPVQARSVMARSGHALQGVYKEDRLLEVEDATVPFAYQHLFHGYVEEHRQLPTWEEFFAWLKGPAIRSWLQPMAESTGWYIADAAQRKRLWKAYRWRAGKAYYSAFREVELLARLRVEYGLPVRYHVLADVLLSVDFWLGDRIVRVYLPDDRYFARKNSPRKYFAARDSSFGILDMEVKRQGFGKFWLADDASVERVARFLEHDRDA